MNDYLIYEPLDVDDEYYNEICKAAWTAMWSSDIQPIPEVSYV